MLTPRTLSRSSDNESILSDPPWLKSKRKYKMGLKPIPADKWITTDPSQEAIDHKLNLLTNRYQDVVAVTADSLESQHAFLKLTGKSSTDLYPDPIADAVSKIAEDVCILDTSDNNRFIAGCVCSPSYWNLKDKIGRPLWDVHEAVDGLNDYIGLNIGRFIEGLSFGRPFARENWFIHGNDQRMHLTPETDLQPKPETWFIRTERETLCRIHENYIAFTINPRFVPLKTIFEFPDAALSLQQVLEGFTEEEIVYFGGQPKLDRLKKFLRGR